MHPKNHKETHYTSAKLSTLGTQDTQSTQDTQGTQGTQGTLGTLGTQNTKSLLLPVYIIFHIYLLPKNVVK